MPGLTISRSNRLETLADALAAGLGRPLASPLQAEVVIVQSLGVRRWLLLELAQRLGVAMNFEFSFPATFLERALSAALGEHPESGRYARELLPWRLLALFPALLERPDFAELRQYLAGANRPLKEFQLAQRIAGVLDRCLAWRPELIRTWDGGGDHSWLATMWRALAAPASPPVAGRRPARGVSGDGQLELSLGREGANAGHLPARIAALQKWLAGGARPLGGIPSRISIFGVSSLPPAFLEAFSGLSRILDIHCYLLTPTPEYWSHLRSPKEQRRAIKRQKSKLSAAELHYETGHPLLASLGLVGREFAEIVIDLEPSAESDLCQPPAEDSMLHGLQADIYQLRTTGADGTPVTRAAVGDRSVQIHDCHGPMREVEVLYDQLLVLFDTHPALEPRHILVTMPDVETYAPYIDAVFGAPEDEALRLPYSIADRSQRAESGIADAFLRLLELPAGRYGVAAVLSLLETASIRARFALAEGDLPLLQRWIERSGIRWGLDAAHRGTLGLPEFAENSWQAGLDRLLLGYALPGDGRTLYEDLLPVAEVEGEAAAKLGSLVDFIDKLAALRGAVAKAQPLAHWTATLRHALDSFFEEDDDAIDELRRVRRVIEDLALLQDAAQLGEPVAFEVICAHLAAAFGSTESGLGFLSGAITFCALKPMRSIPFRVVCMLGMNDGAFPRHEPSLAFDPMSRQRQRGDRTLRDDDRYLFLETILSARDTLYLSYSGRSVRDNSEAPPCAAVGALLEALTARMPAGGLVTKHPLQPFSARYFDGQSGLSSYSQQNLAACIGAQQPRHAAPFCAAAGLPSEQISSRVVEVEEFIEFFVHPARFFGRERLHLRLPPRERALDEREPIDANPLQDYALREQITAHLLAGQPEAHSLALLRAAGALAPGLLGEVWHAGLCREAQALAHKLAEQLAEPKLEPLPVDLTIGRWRLTGVLRDRWSMGLYRYRAGKLKPKDELRAWLAHLILNAVAEEDGPRVTCVYSLGEDLQFGPVEDPLPLLEKLLALYEEGQHAPLPFFPMSSYAFVKNAEGLDRAMAEALKAWRDQHSAIPGEGEDEWVRYLHRGEEAPFGHRWEQIAREVYGPMFTHRGKLPVE